MARTRNFETETLIERALPVFWQQGYAGASMALLVESTGVSRHGIYEEFGSKQGLFLACLDQYQGMTAKQVWGDLLGREATAGEVRGYFERLLRKLNAREGRWGCLMLSAGELSSHNAVVAQRHDAFCQRLKTAFITALRNTADFNAQGRSLDSWADYFLGVVFATTALSRAGHPKSRIVNTVHTALAVLP